MFEITLNANQSNQRLDKFLKKYLKNAPDSFIYRMLRKKNITLNGAKALGSEKTVAGDTVQFFLSEATYLGMRGEKEPVPDGAPDFPDLPILYEDNDVMVFVKPQGLLSQKADKDDYSVNEWVCYHAVEQGLVSSSEFESFRPSVCNRLDRNTAGIMTAGLSLRGLQTLSNLFHDHLVEKYYYTLVKGEMKEPVDFRCYLKKDQYINKVSILLTEVPGAKEIHTAFTPVKIFSDRTLVLVRLYTGRTHQIRSVLAYLGHPVLGDTKYGSNKFNMKYGIYSQCLLACRLKFPVCGLRGVSGKTFELDVPADWPLS